MGSTSAQGTYLLVFIVGFTLVPAGLYTLGWLVALIGLLLIGVAFAGFHSIKENPVPGTTGTRRASATRPLEARSAGNV